MSIAASCRLARWSWGHILIESLAIYDILSLLASSMDQWVVTDCSLFFSWLSRDHSYSGRIHNLTLTNHCS